MINPKPAVGQPPAFGSHKKHFTELLTDITNQNQNQNIRIGNVIQYSDLQNKLFLLYQAESAEKQISNYIRIFEASKLVLVSQNDNLIFQDYLIKLPDSTNVQQNQQSNEPWNLLVHPNNIQKNQKYMILYRSNQLYYATEQNLVRVNNDKSQIQENYIKFTRIHISYLITKISCVQWVPWTNQHVSFICNFNLKGQTSTIFYIFNLKDNIIEFEYTTKDIIDYDFGQIDYSLKSIRSIQALSYSEQQFQKVRDFNNFTIYLLCPQNIIALYPIALKYQEVDAQMIDVLRVLIDCNNNLPHSEDQNIPVSLKNFLKFFLIKFQEENDLISFENPMRYNDLMKTIGCESGSIALETINFQLDQNHRNFGRYSSITKLPNTYGHIFICSGYYLDDDKEQPTFGASHSLTYYFDIYYGIEAIYYQPQSSQIKLNLIDSVIDEYSSEAILKNKNLVMNLKNFQPKVLNFPSPRNQIFRLIYLNKILEINLRGFIKFDEQVIKEEDMESWQIQVESPLHVNVQIQQPKDCQKLEAEKLIFLSGLSIENFIITLVKTGQSEYRFDFYDDQKYTFVKITENDVLSYKSSDFEIQQFPQVKLTQEIFRDQAKFKEFCDNFSNSIKKWNLKTEDLSKQFQTEQGLILSQIEKVFQGLQPDKLADLKNQTIQIQINNEQIEKRLESIYQLLEKVEKLRSSGSNLESFFESLQMKENQLEQMEQFSKEIEDIQKNLEEYDKDVGPPEIDEIREKEELKQLKDLAQSTRKDLEAQLEFMKKKMQI